jgi:hypothetical protein
MSFVKPQLVVPNCPAPAKIPSRSAKSPKDAGIGEDLESLGQGLVFLDTHQHTRGNTVAGDRDDRALRTEFLEKLEKTALDRRDREDIR